MPHSDEERPISALVSLAALLLACANNLLLAQSYSQQREVAIRLALGPGKTRIWARCSLRVSCCLSLVGSRDC
jgi:hypothetical protein